MTAEVPAFVLAAEQAAKAKATYPEEFQGLIEYMALCEAMRSSGGTRTGVDGVHSYEGLVLKYGFPALGADRPNDIKQGTMKECYTNALLLAIERDWIYVEGYAATKNLGIPMSHAWCARHDGTVVDPTWTDGAVYFGIPMNRRFAWDLVVENGYYGVLGNDWVKGGRLLRHGFVTDEDERTGLAVAIGIGGETDTVGA